MPANQATLSRLEAVLARLETVAAKLGIESVPKKGTAHSTADIKLLVERLEAAVEKIEQQRSLGAEGKDILSLGHSISSYFNLEHNNNDFVD